MKQYDAWWKRIDSASIAPSVDAALTAVTESISKQDTVEILVLSEKQLVDETQADCLDDDKVVENKISNEELKVESKPSATSLLMQLASDIDKKQAAKNSAKKPEILNCFLDFIERPKFGLEESAKSKYEKMKEYELKVLNHFFVFDNSM